MRRRIELGRTLILLACLTFFALGAAREGAAQGLNQESVDAAQKFDEFGELHGCDYGAHLDNFAVQLQNQPAHEGYIISYGPEGDGSGTGNYALGAAKEYLVSLRGLDAERIKTIYAGRYKEWNQSATELWIAPPDAAPPEPVRYNTRPEIFTGKFEEFDDWEDFGSYFDEVSGPTTGNVHRASLADILHQQPDARLWIVAYNKKGALPGAWRRVAKDIAGNLKDGYKIEAERVEIIYAGYREQEQKKEDEGRMSASVFVQLWILPKDAPPPVAEVKEAEERPSAVVQLGSYNIYQMADESFARVAFDGFADVLRSDDKLNICLIVRLPKKTEQTVEADETPKPDNPPAETAEPSQLPKADLMALVEKWKADLVKDYGISAHRLVVTTGEADEWSAGGLETWAVPPGAALPDPNVKDEMDATVETSEEGEAIAVEEATPKEF